MAAVSFPSRVLCRKVYCWASWGRRRLLFPFAPLSGTPVRALLAMTSCGAQNFEVSEVAADWHELMQGLSETAACGPNVTLDDICDSQ